MPNREVNLTKRINTPSGLRYARWRCLLMAEIKPDVVLVNGEEEHHPEGAYYLEWREGAKPDVGLKT